MKERISAGDVESSPKCPVCRTAEAVAITAWRYRDWEIKECSRCFVQFAWPFVAGKLEYYSEYATYKKMRSDVEANRVHPGNLRISKWISASVAKYVTKPPAATCVLDYGCGSGYFAAVCAKDGRIVQCVDFNPEMVKIAEECYGLPATTKSAAVLLAEDVRYDVILLNHVLEHLENPIQLLEMLRSLLNEGGIICVSLPNRDYFRERRKLLDGRLFDGHYPPHHVTFWSSAALRSALSDAGFHVAECQGEPYPQEEAAILGVQRRLGALGGVSVGIAKACVLLGSALNISGANLLAVGVRRS